MSEKFYVVVESGWEYNDERMYKGESSGGMPVLVHTTEEQANAACVEKTLDRFKQFQRSGSSCYDDSLAEYQSEDGIGDLFTEAGLQIMVDAGKFTSVEAAMDDYDYSWNLKDLSEEQLRALAAELTPGSCFFEVVEVVQ